MSGDTKFTFEKKNPYEDTARKLLDEARKLKEEQEGWTDVVEKDGTKLQKKDRKDICNLPCYLVSTKIKKSMADLVDKIWGVNEERAKKNDPKLLMWKQVEGYPDWKVCSQYSGMAPFWPRHMIFAQTKFEEKDGKTVYLVAHSIKHSDVNVDTKTHVEGKLHLSVYEFKDNGDGTTSIWRLTQADPCGSVPHWLINWYATNLVDMFNRWK